MYLKFLTIEGFGPYSGFDWPIGEWVEVEGPLEMCTNGIHVCTIEQAVLWLDARCHPVEIRGERFEGRDKLCVRAARLGPALEAWNDRSARLFAADCAEHVLHIFEREIPGDDRPRKAIEVARQFANGEATEAERAAAGVAAEIAAWDAAEIAAGAAARAAARTAAGVAAGVAAGDSAGDAAWVAAACNAAGVAERKWQAERLAEVLGFDAARGGEVKSNET